MQTLSRKQWNYLKQTCIQGINCYKFQVPTMIIANDIKITLDYVEFALFECILEALMWKCYKMLPHIHADIITWVYYMVII